MFKIFTIFSNSCADKVAIKVGFIEYVQSAIRVVRKATHIGMVIFFMNTRPIQLKPISNIAAGMLPVFIARIAASEGKFWVYSSEKSIIISVVNYGSMM